MDGKYKSRKSTTNTSAHGWFDLHKSRNSKRSGEEKLACSGCKREFLVPTTTTAYRCFKCQAVSGYKQSREGTNGGLLSGLSPPKPSSSLSSLFTSATGNKRAVLCGVTYTKRKKFKLSGPVNDVINMKALLVDKFNFPMDRIRVLTEEEQDPNFIPTRRNMMESLKWLVKDCQSGDSLVFYFSGHGLQQPEYDTEDEIDGLDETICPVDFMKEGMITDNEINSTIVRPLKKGVKLHAIIDACHSGSALDLMYVYKKHNGSWNWVDNKPPSKEPIPKGTSGGLAICLSACEDSQMAADTAVFGGKEMNGAMTYLLTKTIREHSGITYADLLEKLHQEIAKIHRSKHYNGLFRRIFHRKVGQDPLLSSSEKFEVSTRTSF